MKEQSDDSSKKLKRHRHHYNVSEYPTTTRIEAFSDGVIAIIVTIMVLELKVPQLAEHFTREQFLQEGVGMLPKLLAYAMSFVVVAIFWVNHHGFFHSLKKSDGKLLWFNNFLLFWLSLVPFVTAFLGEHPKSVEAVMGYGFVLMMSGLAFPLMGNYAMFKADLMRDEIGQGARKLIYRRNFPGVVLYTMSVLSAPVSIWISWAIFFIVPLYYFMPRQFERTDTDPT